MIASGPVIVNKNKVLLNISGNDDFWKFIGGRLMVGEDLQGTAIRRAREEMGVDIKIKDKAPFFMYHQKDSEEGPIDVILVHWLAAIGSQEIVPGPMVKEWAWLEVKGDTPNLAPNILPALRHFGFVG